MKSKLLNQPWIPLERIESIIQLEPALMVLGLAAGAWLVYKLFLREVSVERHRNLRSLFANLLVHLVIWIPLFAGYLATHQLAEENEAFQRIASYLGLLSLLSGSTVFVKTWRILVFEYLFLGHMRAGVPVLLVNLSTLALSMLIGGWLITEIFSIRLAPLLATSAIFSIVLGLALQDTLGNLFAGVALQFDKPYEIGDWVEVQSGLQKWCGQVHEISWRATVLVGLADEAITIPNRVMAQAQVSNFTLKSRPIIRSQLFRLPFGTPIEPVKTLMLEAVASINGIRKHPAPLVLITETHESWIPFKLVYFMDDYGAQWGVSDRVISGVTQALEAKGHFTAVTRIAVEKPQTAPPV